MTIASIANIASSLLGYGAAGPQGPRQQMQAEFQKLGQDLQSGNLAAAQTDVAMLQPAGSQANAAAALPAAGLHARGHHRPDGDGDGGGGASPASQLLAQLGASLQSGNLSAAQQAYSALQQDAAMFGVNTSPAASGSPMPGAAGLSLSA
ncbi:MAG TPA: hypothetical protein VMV31_05330 [Terriglobales bacterium]|nr:hypothetical protein [Terriglobales bacterium]